MIREFYDEEREYAAFLVRGETFVLNDFPGYRRLHRGDCTMLNRAGSAAIGRRTSVRKVCGNNLEELVAYVVQTRAREGDAYEKCFFCFRD